MICDDTFSFQVGKIREVERSESCLLSTSPITDFKPISARLCVVRLEKLKYFNV